MLTGDNIGLYPLLQRRCRLIIVCDGERDPDYNFTSLSAAIRQIYTDENVDVDINLNKIRPAEGEKRPKAHFVVGRIIYPVKDDDGQPMKQLDDDPAAENSDGENPNGWIIYLKSSFLDRDEAATVKSYAARHSDFPHQTTADQFFSDDQFEAYRALGAIIAKDVLKEAGCSDPDRAASGLTADELIKWCSKQYERDSIFTTDPPESRSGGRAKKK